MTDYDDSDGSGLGNYDYDEDLEEIIADYYQRYHEHNNPDYSGNDSGYGYESYDERSGAESESENDSNELESFFVNFHKGNYDDEIERSLDKERSLRRAFEPAASTESHPDDEALAVRESAASSNLKERLQYVTLQVDAGIFSPFCELEIRVTDDGSMVSHDRSLIPHWNQLSNALGQLQQHEIYPLYNFQISHIELTKETMQILSRGLRGTVSLECLTLGHTNLCGEGIKLLSAIVEHSPGMSKLVLRENPVVDLDAFRCLSRALKKNPCLIEFFMTKCNIGDNVDILTAILEADLKVINLYKNGIGKAGAVVISKHIEANPELKDLQLNGNEFNNDDAILFARALSSNTHLRELSFRENDFSLAGAKSLLTGVFDATCLNALWESNHTCSLDICCTRLHHFFNNLNAIYDKRSKILMALHEPEALLQYLNDVTVEFMPNVLGMMQKEEDQCKLINMIYATMKGWKMPSMYGFCSASSSGNLKRKRDSIE